MFRVYKTRVFANGTWFNEVWIDPHYEINHGESINDLLILSLVRLLSDCDYDPQRRPPNGFQYFESNLIWLRKPYRLIWLIPPDESYIGIRNAYRRSA